jgi:hypothetical protein
MCGYILSTFAQTEAPMPGASIFESVQRPKPLEAKVADIVKNGGSSSRTPRCRLVPIPKMTTATQGSVPHGYS